MRIDDLVHYRLGFLALYNKVRKQDLAIVNKLSRPEGQMQNQPSMAAAPGPCRKCAFCTRPSISPKTKKPSRSLPGRPNGAFTVVPLRILEKLSPDAT
jgi:hypothetical protein